MGTISPLDDNLTIGNYEIIEKLGGWSSGSVYRGLDPELGRAVVIRVLRETISWTPGLEERFRRDYAAAAGLKHPNIVTVYEIGKEGAFPYIGSAQEPDSGTRRDSADFQPKSCRRRRECSAPAHRLPAERR